MAARTGAEYIKGLQAQEREVWLRGERVKDVTTHPGLANGVRAIASLYDQQHDPTLRDEMTYVSPTSGERLGLSFVIPRTQAELQRRGAMMLRWARTTCGMMGRSPDFMNVTFAAWAAASSYFGRGRPQFAENIKRYHEYISEKDLTLTHSLINLQRSRTLTGVFNLQEGTALQVVRETDAGGVVESVLHERVHALRCEAMTIFVLYKTPFWIDIVGVQQRILREDQRLVLLTMILHPGAHGPYLLRKDRHVIVLGKTVDQRVGTTIGIAATLAYRQARVSAQCDVGDAVGCPFGRASGSMYKCMFQTSTGIGAPYTRVILRPHLVQVLQASGCHLNQASDWRHALRVALLDEGVGIVIGARVHLWIGVILGSVLTTSWAWPTIGLVADQPKGTRCCTNQSA